jgi:hypothetical protein
MNAVIRLCLTLTVTACSACSHATYFSPACATRELDDHVRQEFAVYGPQSGNREYFAFIYELQGSFGSAVVRGNDCRGPERCVVDAAGAVAQIPKGANVVGEWHTHPHIGATSLSSLDVRGAHHNRHLNCYTPYYSNPIGEIYAWNPDLDSVPTANNSRVLIGTYGERQAREAHGGRRHAS